MAQTIHCDGTDHRDVPADILVSRIANGDTSAWCNDHFLEFCLAVVQAAEAAEAELRSADQASLANLEGSAPGPGELADDGDQDASASGFPGAAEPDDRAGDPAGPESVQEGLGATETGEGGEEAPESAADVLGQPGGPGEPQRDPGEAIPAG